MDKHIQFFEKGDSRQVFVSAELVGDPLASFSPIVQIQHRRHRVHTKTVDMIFVQPEERTVLEKIFDFHAAVVKDATLPFRMIAKPRILVVI